MACVERLGGVGWGRGAGEEVGPAGVGSRVGVVGSRLGGLTDVEVGVWIITLWGDCGASGASSWDGEGGRVVLQVSGCGLEITQKVEVVGMPNRPIWIVSVVVDTQVCTSSKISCF